MVMFVAVVDTLLKKTSSKRLLQAITPMICSDDPALAFFVSQLRICKAVPTTFSQNAEWPLSDSIQIFRNGTPPSGL